MCVKCMWCVSAWGEMCVKCMWCVSAWVCVSKGWDVFSQGKSVCVCVYMLLFIMMVAIKAVQSVWYDVCVCCVCGGQWVLMFACMREKRVCITWYILPAATIAYYATTVIYARKSLITLEPELRIRGRGGWPRVQSGIIQHLEFIDKIGTRDQFHEHFRNKIYVRNKISCSAFMLVFSAH